MECKKDPFVRIAWAIGISIFLILCVLLGTGNSLAQSQITTVVGSLCIFGIVIAVLDLLSIVKIAEYEKDSKLKKAKK